MRISDWSSDVCSSDLASGSPCSGDTVNRTGARRMIDLHYWPTPNGHKITMFLEETGLDYRILPVNIGAGEKFKPDFLKIAPRSEEHTYKLQSRSRNSYALFFLTKNQMTQYNT